MDSRLVGLVIVFAPLSLLSFGGGQAIVADIQHQTVSVHGWLTGPEFADLFAISRAAPGPSTLIAALIGWQVAGMGGALAATLAIYLPSSLVVFAVARVWQRYQESDWRAAIERGLAPVAVGLIFAGALAVLKAAQAGPLDLLTTACSTAILYFTKASPYMIVAGAALVYAALQLV